MRLAVVSAAARYCGRSERTVRSYIYRGALSVFRVPGVRGQVVDLDEVDKVVPRPKATAKLLDTAPEAVIQ
ncbi:hypothetical protein [Isoptericola sp. NPDC058082]|uniref:hypothetical protein n=1 Tax=Isoptericola sp. NPDC058082 TaxID=3346331 RepID=UPI0036EB7A4C